MTTYDQAKEIVLQKLPEISQQFGYKLVLMEDQTITFEYGWAFFYYPEVGLNNPKLRFGGGGPLIVNKRAGWIIQVPSRNSPQHFIEIYSKFMDDWSR